MSVLVVFFYTHSSFLFHFIFYSLVCTGESCAQPCETIGIQISCCMQLRVEISHSTGSNQSGLFTQVNNYWTLCPPPDPISSANALIREKRPSTEGDQIIDTLMFNHFLKAARISQSWAVQFKTHPVHGKYVQLCMVRMFSNATRACVLSVLPWEELLDQR